MCIFCCVWQEELQRNTTNITIRQMKRRLDKDLKTGMKNKTNRKDKKKEYRDNQKEEANEYQKRCRQKETTELKQSKREYHERGKSRILAKAKQQLIECEICKYQIKRGSSNSMRLNEASKQISNIGKKDEQ